MKIFLTELGNAIDAQGFVNGLEQLINNDIKLGQQGKKDMEMYKPKIIRDKWENLMNDLVTNK